MSAPSRRRSDSSTVEVGLLWVVLGITLGATAVVTVSAHLVRRFTGDLQAAPLPANPLELLLGVIGGTVAWGPASTAVAVALVTLLAVVAFVVALFRWRTRGLRVDKAAPHLGRGTELAPLTRRGTAATGQRLGVDGPAGLPIGRTLTGQTLYSSWEDMAVDIWGPRTGKTTSRAIPAVLDAPGAVLVTSNKRDIVDGTRGPRSRRGQVWVFDPQGVVDEPPTWWWNPLSYVTDEVKATILADIFATSSRDPQARTDAYFDSAATDLLAGLLLAAARDDRTITDVYQWLTDPTDDEPASILADHDLPLSASAVAGIIAAPEKQRGGVYGTAQQMTACLINRAATRWVTPTGPHDPRPQFSPDDFIRSGPGVIAVDGGPVGHQTLYSVSREGRGSAGPLVTALTVAVTEAAEAHVKTSPGGRLPVPLVGVLDEAANVCRWAGLPDQYSHYGSRGIVMMTILQSWSQGVDVWGREGMRKLWSAANVKVYGGGVTEAEFLNELSQLIGDFEVRSVSTSSGRGGRQTSRSYQRERILDVADLAALPRGRAIVLASGAPATIVQTLPWMTGPHAAEVRESLARHDPAARLPHTAAPAQRRRPVTARPR